MQVWQVARNLIPHYAADAKARMIEGNRRGGQASIKDESKSNPKLDFSKTEPQANHQAAKAAGASNGSGRLTL